MFKPVNYGRLVCRIRSEESCVRIGGGGGLSEIPKRGGGGGNCPKYLKRGGETKILKRGTSWVKGWVP